MAPPRIRRRLEDQSAAAMTNARRFRRPPNTPPPGLSFNRGPNTPPPGMGRDLTSGIASLRRPAVGNTAGRRGWKAHPFLSRSTGRAPLTPRTIFSTPEENEDNRLSSGIMNTLPANNLMAEIGLPATMDWQTDPYEKLSLDELMELGASEEQISAYLGLA